MATGLGNPPAVGSSRLQCGVDAVDSGSAGGTGAAIGKETRR